MTASLTARTLATALHKPGAACSYEATATVAAETRFMAEFTTELCALECGVEAPALVWFKCRAGGSADPERGSWQDESVRGRALPEYHAVAVRSDMTVNEIVETTAHEVSHLALHALTRVDERFPTFRNAPGWHEQKAEDYGRRFRAFFESGSRLHRHDGFPYRGTLGGVAATDDLLLAEDPDGDQALYRNLASRAWPEWNQISATPSRR